MKHVRFVGIAFLGLVVAGLACSPTIPQLAPTTAPIVMPSAVSVPTEAPTLAPTLAPTVTPTATTAPVPTAETGGGKTGDAPTVAPTPEEDAGGSKGGGETAGNANLTLVNDSDAEVCFVYISSTDSDSWGEDWLGGDETILPGDQRKFSLAAGSYDVLAEDCDGNAIEERYGVSISGAQEWALSGASSAEVHLTLYNDSGSEICYVYISPTTSDSWGDDWLGSSTVLDGDFYDFMVPAGSYDLLAEDCSQNTVDERYGVTISADRDWSIGYSGGGQATLTVANDTNTTVYYVYISPSDSDSWGDDWLGSDVIDPGESYTFYLNEGDYDLRAEDMDYNALATRFGEHVSGDVQWTLNAQGEASLTLENGTGVSVCYVYISPSDSSDWGGDWLGSDEIIDSGGSRVFSLPADTYDILAEDCSGNTLDEQYGVDIVGDMFWTLS